MVAGVAALVDRVFAMYLGERIAEGTADEVMRNPTVRRVYLGGEITASQHRAAAGAAKLPLLEVEDVSVFYGKAQALDKVGMHVGQGEFVSIVGLNGAGKTTLFNAMSGLVPYSGKITFKVKNSSKDTIHEMIVMYRADSAAPLPYVDAENRVDEDKAGDKGEVSELDPGASGTLTVDLKPGKYVLICNVPGHFATGMWTEFTVKP